MNKLIFLFLTIMVEGLYGQCMRTGSFVAADPAQYAVSGDASIVEDENGNVIVRFEENFATVQGLALEVFISKTGNLDRDTDIQISMESLDKGSRTGTDITGVHEFMVPENVALEDFDHVLIQCTSINALWGNVAFGVPEGNCGNTTSTSETPLDRISLYPNPASQTLHVNHYKPNMTITIFNTLGKKMMGDIQSNTIDISGLYKGTYILSLLHKDDKRILRFIKE